MRAEIIALGMDLPGMGASPSASGLAEEMAELGLELGSVTFVRAEDREVEDAVRQALRRSRLAVVTGGRPAGLASSGTEREDLAKKILSRLLDKRLVLQGDILKKMEAAYRARSMEPPAGYEKAALLPHGARAVEDRQGVPAGFYMEHGGRYILFLPGLPESFREAMPEELAAALAAGRRPRRWERSRVIRSYGLEEARVKEALKGVAGKDAMLDLFASLEGVDVRVRVRTDTQERAESLLGETCAKVAAKLGDYCYGAGAEGLEEVVARLLTEKRLTIATAESCTGGLVAKRLTDVPGSSAYMERGVVTYSNKSKQELIGVPGRTIEEHGAVSKETAEAMAQGIRWNAKTHLGLSITGIAGPSGGTLAKPVGLVYISLATPDDVTVKGYNFPGDREAIRFATSQRALDIVRRYLLS